jgi:hypothetical protein
MVEECVYLYLDGRKCRRIPKRGQNLCSTHRPLPRRRAPLEESEDVMRRLLAFADTLRAMPIADLLYETSGLLADIHVLIDRRSSRRHRIAFHRACAAVVIAADRLEEIAQRSRPQSTTHPAAQTPPAPASSQALTPGAKARLERLDAFLSSGPHLSPDELTRICNELISITESNAETTCTLDSNA